MRALLLALLIACAGFAPAASALTDQEKDAFALLTLTPKDNPVKQCMVFGLELNLGMTALRLSGADDAAVRASLTARLSDPELLALRERQAAAWQAGHDPAMLAEMNLAYCLAKRKVNVNLASVARPCFTVTGIAAQAETLKSAHVSREEAVAQTRRAYAPKVPAEFVTPVVESVYAADYTKDAYLAHRQVFVQCVRGAAK
jgi:hypothetical protein